MAIRLLLSILNDSRKTASMIWWNFASIHTNDQPLARLIVHRIAGRTAQMGSGQLAEFRTMEIELSRISGKASG
ncbi:hypothetical protein CS542_03115 [Pedobacter sp. IW39]|nr:hypothetical protein CS542_03115 [Pedobacter sp. IW39]